MIRETELPRLPRLVARRGWANLPVLLVLNAVVVVSLLPAFALFVLGVELPSLLLSGVCFGAAWTTTVACTDRVVRGEQPSLRDVGGTWRRVASRGARLGACGGAVATVTLGTLTLYQANPHQWWLLVPLFVDGAVLSLTVLAGSVACSLAVGTGLRGRRLLWGALAVTARNPWPIAGTLALLVLAGFAVAVMPSIVVLLPAPFAVLVSAIVLRDASMHETTSRVPQGQGS